MPNTAKYLLERCNPATTPALGQLKYKAKMVSTALPNVRKKTVRPWFVDTTTVAYSTEIIPALFEDSMVFTLFGAVHVCRPASPTPFSNDSSSIVLKLPYNADRFTRDVYRTQIQFFKNIIEGDSLIFEDLTAWSVVCDIDNSTADVSTMGITLMSQTPYNYAENMLLMVQATFFQRLDRASDVWRYVFDIKNVSRNVRY